jgi:transglutaminase-like putative cysteine protease
VRAIRRYVLDDRRAHRRGGGVGRRQGQNRHAHIFIAAARTIGVPARYITGYLVVGAEGSADAHHAWAEAWVEGLGWVGFDVANRICPTERYVRLAAGLDAGYAAPITGSRKGGAEEKLDVAVEVQQQSAQQ